jgi:hypothetical protein
MAYIQRPVIYYTFEDDPLQVHFGPVVKNAVSLLKELEALLKNNCQPKLEYLQRMEDTFAFRDGGCCERVYQAIRELDWPRVPWDFDREVLIDYAKHAEAKGDHEFANKCWQKLLTYGDDAQQGFARSHLNLYRRAVQ